MNRYMKMKLMIAMLMVCMTSLFAQKNNLVNTWNYLRSRELDKAKAAIDAAALNDDTKNSPKMWLYRAQTYMSLMESKEEKFKTLDPDAAEKAFTSVVNCLKTDKDKLFYDDAKGLLMPAALRLYNKALQVLDQKQYDNAMRYTAMIFDGLPFDKDDAMKHQNLTNDKLNYQLFSIAYSAKNFTAAKDYLQKLIDVKYKDANIYLVYSNICLEEKDTAKALSYIEKGRNLFEDNVPLINQELFVYTSQRKLDILAEKTKKAIETTPDNEILHYNLGAVYAKRGQNELAEISYKKAIELKPDYTDAIFNLGALYLAKGIDLASEAEKIPPKETKKFNEMNEKANTEFKKALPYLEKAYQTNSDDMNIARNLRALYQKLGENEKYQKLKDEMDKKKSPQVK